MAVNKVVLGEDTLIDLTGDTVSADKLSKGVTAHNMAGEPIVGTMEAGGGKVYTFTNGLTETDGTVSWDLNDRIKAGTESESIIIGCQEPSNSYYHNEVSNTGAVAIGGGCKASGMYSIASGMGLTKNNSFGIITEGDGSLAHGYTSGNSFIKASGTGATAIGYCKLNTEIITASGEGSFAGGYPNRQHIIASGTASFAFGRNGNQATGVASLAIGDGNIASDTGSSAFGSGTKANSANQCSTGKYNVADTNKVFANIIGNGSSDSSRSNATAIDWQGNQYLSGDIYTNCTDYTTTSTGLNTPRCGGKKLATEEYVDTRIPAPPSADGEYNLHCSIVSGVPTYSWKAEQQ